MQRALTSRRGDCDQLLFRLRDEFRWGANRVAIANCMPNDLGIREYLI